MSQGLNFEKYTEYLARLHVDSGVAPLEAIEDARSRWGVRRLSRSEFDALMDSTKVGSSLRERWLTRLQKGYDREKASLADEIEDLFAQLPCASPLTPPSEDAA